MNNDDVSKHQSRYNPDSKNIYIYAHRAPVALILGHIYSLKTDYETALLFIYYSTLFEKGQNPLAVLLFR